MSTKLVEKDSLRNLSGSEAGPGAEGVDTITGDMMKYLTRRPDLCLHQLSPGLCILFRRLLCRAYASQTMPEHWSYDTAGFSFSQSGCKSREASRTMAAFFFYSSEPKAGPASLPSPAF